MAAFRVYEDEVVLIFPCIPGCKLILSLLRLDLLQDFHHGRSRLYDARLAVLR